MSPFCDTIKVWFPRKRGRDIRRKSFFRRSWPVCCKSTVFLEGDLCAKILLLIQYCKERERRQRERDRTIERSAKIKQFFSFFFHLAYLTYSVPILKGLKSVCLCYCILACTKLPLLFTSFLCLSFLHPYVGTLVSSNVLSLSELFHFLPKSIYRSFSAIDRHRATFMYPLTLPLWYVFFLTFAACFPVF